nr:MAG TPA: hypothetical protein [Bacteriophage sp.]
MIYLSTPFTSSSFIHQPSAPLLTCWFTLILQPTFKQNKKPRELNPSTYLTL